jgi:type I restriction enzyme, S subunit
MNDRFSEFSPPFFDFLFGKSVPEDWNWISLVNVTHPKQWENLPQSSFLNQGFPVYGANGHIGFYSEYNHKEPVIAVSCRGACGDIHLTKPFSYVSSNAMCLDNVSDEIDQNFLYFALNYRTLGDTISGSAQPQITRQSLQVVKFPAPTLPEQKKIASILTSVDELIERTHKQINKLQDLKKAIMNELLTKGIDHTEFKDSELGRIPKSWEVKSLGEIVFKITDGEHLSPKIVSRGKPILSAKDIREEGVQISGVKFVEPIPFQKMLSRCKPEFGDVLIVSRGASIGRVTLNNLNFQFALMGSVILIKPDQDKLMGEFIALCLGTENTQDEMMGLSGSSAQQAIYLKDIKNLKLPIPSLPEQSKISSLVRSIDHQKKNLNSKLTQTQSLKKSLMQVLLTGKVRVKVN